MYLGFGISEIVNATYVNIIENIFGGSLLFFNISWNSLFPEYSFSHIRIWGNLESPAGIV